MKKGRRIVALALALLMVAGLFAACGKGTDTSKETTPAADQSTVQATQEESSQTTAAPAELEGKITINLGAGPGAKEAWDAVAKGYMEKHPKVQVVVDLKPSEGYAEWVKSMFGSANPESDLIAINLAGPAANDKNINFMEYANSKSPYSDGAWKDQFNFELQGGKDLARGTWGNLSLESVQVLWCYNKDIFAKVGVEPPKTWDELIKVCEKLQSAGYQPLAVPGDFNSFWAMQMGWLAQIYADQTTRSQIEIVRAKDGDYNYDAGVDGKFTFNASDPYNDDAWKVNTNPVRFYKALKEGQIKGDSAGYKAVLTNFKKVFPKYAGGASFFGTKDSLPAFYQGKAAIYLDGAWRLSSFKNDMDKLNKGEEIKSNEKKIEGVKKFELGTFNMPSMEGPEFEAPARTIEVAVGFIGAVKKDKAHDDLVMDFLMYYSSKEGYSKYLGAGLTAGISVNGPPLVYGVELPAEYAALFKDLKFIGNCQKGFGGAIARGAPGDVQESLREWYTYTQEFMTDKINIDQWAQKNQANIMKYLPTSMKNSKITDSDLQNPQNAPTGK